MSIWPRRMTLAGALEHDGAERAVVARSVPSWILWSTVTIEVDGEELPLTRKY